MVYSWLLIRSVGTSQVKVPLLSMSAGIGQHRIYDSIDRVHTGNGITGLSGGDGTPLETQGNSAAGGGIPGQGGGITGSEDVATAGVAEGVGSARGGDQSREGSSGDDRGTHCVCY